MQLSFGRLQVSRTAFPQVADLHRRVELEILAFAETPWGARELADLLETTPDSPERIAEKVLRALACGALEYDAWAPPAGLVGATATPTALTELSVEELPELAIHAVVLELIDTQDRPVARAAYRLLDPEGRTHTGILDGGGRAEIHNIRKAGHCKVSFPEFDNLAWTYVHAHPL